MLVVGTRTQSTISGTSMPSFRLELNLHPYPPTHIYNNKYKTFYLYFKIKFILIIKLFILFKFCFKTFYICNRYAKGGLGNSFQQITFG
jgi:hypothetical protein